MKKVTIMMFVISSFIGYSNAQTTSPTPVVKEDKTSTSEEFVLPETLEDLQAAKTFLNDLITKTTADIEEEKQTIVLLNKNKAKLDATDPELKVAQKEIDIHNQSLANFNTLLASYKKNMASVDEAIEKLAK